MATIFNTVERVAREDQTRFTTKVELLWDTTLASVAKVEDDDVMISGPYYTIADADGYWEIDDVYPNDVITPSDSVYRVTESFSDDSSQSYFIEVPSAATPTFWTGDLTTPAPAWL